MLICILGTLLASGVEAKTFAETRAHSPAERFVIRSLRRTGTADLSELPETQRSLPGSFLADILFNLPDSEFPIRSLQIMSANVEGEIRPPEEGTTIARDIAFYGCSFDDLDFSGVTFERSLRIYTLSYLRRLRLNYTHIKGNLVLLGVKPPTPRDSLEIELTGAHIEGYFTLNAVEFTSVLGSRVSARAVSVGNIHSANGNIDLSNLEAEELIVGRSGVTNLETLTVANAVIKGDLLVRSSTIRRFDASGIRVGLNTDIEGNFFNELDLTFSTFGDFKLRVPGCPNQNGTPCWPGKISIGAVSFRNLGVGKYSEHNRGTHHMPDVTPDQTSMGLEFLGRALYSEPAYLSFEQALRSRGLLADADNVYRAMHGHKRDRVWHESTGFFGTLGAAGFILLDHAQSIFLGYGRSALQPLLWSFAFVTFGTFVFWENKRMETVGEHPPRYSPFWYSLELFLPVVDLGVAKSWRPAQRSLPLLTYGRIHQLAGWVLIPVALAAITGAFK